MPSSYSHCLPSIGLVFLILSGRCAATEPTSVRLPALNEKLRGLPVVFVADQSSDKGQVSFGATVGAHHFAIGPREVAVGQGDEPLFQMRLVGGRPASAVEPLDPTGGHSSFFVGDPKNWRTALPHYRRVQYAAAYPGIDWVFHGSGRAIEYDFNVAPNADPSRIEIEYRGARGLRLSAEGDLMIETRIGSTVTQRKPVIYQNRSGRQVEIAGGYVVRGKDRIAFRIGAYDHSSPLIIDPVLVFSAIIGGESTDYAYATTADSAGNSYVTGATTSMSFPSSGLKVGSIGAFVYKMNPSGTALIYSVVIGGGGASQFESYAGGTGIRVDAQGNTYIAGTTDYSNFPTTPNAYQGGYPPAQYSAIQHAFVLSLNASGSALRYSTYLRGSFYDVATGIAIDSTGNAYVSGNTRSTDFPTTSGAYQTANPTPTMGSGFVTKLNAAGTSLVFSTYLGAPSSVFNSRINAIAATADGHAYVVGTTGTTEYPTTPGAFETATSQLGVQYGFVTRLNSTGSGLDYSSLITGNGIVANGVAVDSTGAAYVTGDCFALDYPNTVQVGSNVGSDIFALKLNPAGTAAAYLKKIGGGAEDHGNSIAIDSGGNAYVAGSTLSTDFPLEAALQTTMLAGTPSAVVLKLNPSGTLVFSTFLGGANNGDSATAIAVGQTDTVYVAGRAGGYNYPVTLGAAGKAISDGFDTFLTAINTSSTCAFSLSTQQGSQSSVGGQGSVDVSTAAGCNWIAASFVPWVKVSGGAAGSGPGTVVYTADPNSDIARSAKFSVAGLDFTVNQANGCKFSFSRSVAAVSTGGGLLVLNLQTGEHCPWTFPTHLPSWIQTGTGSNVGSQTLGFTVSNNAGAARSYLIDMNGATLLITQSSAATCNVLIDPLKSKPYPFSGGSGSVAIEADGACNWTTSSTDSWLHIDQVASALGTTGSGGRAVGTIFYHLDANAGAARSGAVIISGASYTISQAARLTSKVAAYSAGYWVQDLNGNFAWDGLATDRLTFWSLGRPNEIPVYGDWNGDGQTKIGLYIDGTWLLDYNGNGVWDGPDVDKLIYFGGPGYTPYVGDWNGSGTSKIAVHQNGTWLIDYNGNFQWDGLAVDKLIYFGGPGYTPVLGDWNGSGSTKIGVHQNGTWILDFNGNFQWDGPSTDKLLYFGGPGYTAVVGDWNGSGTTKIAAHLNGLWLVDYNGNFAWDGPGTDKMIFFGGAGYTPVVGDWTGSQTSKIGAYKDGQWVIDVNGNFTWDLPTDQVIFFGGPAQMPIVGKW